MEILVDGQALDIPKDFSLELELNNPFFSEDGSQSLPVTLPYTSHNLSLLDNPQSITRTKKILTDRSATVRDGIFQQTARLVVFSSYEEEL
jgi:hypothetical protein